MIHTAITIPEHHDQYPHLWQSACKKFRIVRCCDDIQYIFQSFRTPKWRSLSYHREYESLLFRWHSMPELPAEPPYKVVYRGFSSVYDLALGVDSNEPTDHV
jgi:hypothetical protein